MNCRKCGIELTLENWYPSSKKTRDSICKECVKQHNQDYYLYHKEDIGKKVSEYKKNNKERCKRLSYKSYIKCRKNILKRETNSVTSRVK